MTGATQEQRAAAAVEVAKKKYDDKARAMVSKMLATMIELKIAEKQMTMRDYEF